MKSRILISGSTLALTLLATLPASAGLRVDGEVSGNRAQQSNLVPSNYHESDRMERSSRPAASRGASQTVFENYVSQSGTPNPPDLQTGTVSAGNDVLLSAALRGILPPGFTLADNDVPLRKLASWTGPRSWLAVLADLGRAANFVAHVDWNSREVSLAPAPQGLSNMDVSQAASIPSRSREVREVREIQVLGSNSGRRAVSSRYPAPVAVPVKNDWTLNPSLSLQENVKDWAKKAGWTVVWEGADYPIAASATFRGEFASPNGVLEQLMSAYANSDQPLIVRLTTRDRVVFVRNRVLDRSEVDPLPRPAEFDSQQ